MLVVQCVGLVVKCMVIGTAWAMQGRE